MLRFGLMCLALCLCIFGLASILERSHVVVFGPCASTGAVAIYLMLMLTFLLGALFSVAGGIVWLVEKFRRTS